jgi:hypothetical protein
VFVFFLVSLEGFSDLRLFAAGLVPLRLGGFALIFVESVACQKKGLSLLSLKRR